MEEGLNTLAEKNCGAEVTVNNCHFYELLLISTNQIAVLFKESNTILIKVLRMCTQSSVTENEKKKTHGEKLHVKRH